MKQTAERVNADAMDTPQPSLPTLTCGAVLDLPDDAGLIEDQGAAVRRDFEGRTEQQEQK
ncbi:hypothetical protein ACFW2D_39325 [Streptomyces sp. NPDC058914]|uniref:hypothetical protein n=1 Tax=Streptomyces sp. NPDC058914 TaxID=3346671 RepID=UPI0036C69EBB